MADLDGSSNDTWVYLDTNVLIDLSDALSGTWRPPPASSEALHRSDAQRIAAARLFFYGYRDRPPHWYLVTSGEARAELRQDWTRSVILDVDEVSDAPGGGRIRALARPYEEAGVDSVDALHLARSLARPWIRHLVTSDDKFRVRAQNAGLPPHLTILSLVEAEQALKIRPGEDPPLAPGASSPLASGSRWWIP